MPMIQRKRKMEKRRLIFERKSEFFRLQEEYEKIDSNLTAYVGSIITAEKNIRLAENSIAFNKRRLINLIEAVKTEKSKKELFNLGKVVGACLTEIEFRQKEIDSEKLTLENWTYYADEAEAKLQDIKSQMRKIGKFKKLKKS